VPVLFVLGSERHVVEEGKPLSVGSATVEMRSGRVMLSADQALVGGVAIKKGRARLVRPGDKIEIGGKEAQLESTETSPAVDTRQMALALVKEIGRVRACPLICVAEGDDLGAELELETEGRSYSVGRASTCDLAIADANASREHLRATRKGSRVFVRDVGSARGVFLGSSRLQPNRDAAWDPSVMLRVGDTVLALTAPAMAILDAAIDKLVVETPPAADAPKPLTPVAAAAPIAAPQLHDAPPKRTPTKFLERAALVAGVVVIALCVAGLIWLFK